MLPMTVIDVSQIGVCTLVVIGIITSVNPYFLILTFAIGIVIYMMRSFYITTSRNVARLEGISTSN